MNSETLILIGTLSAALLGFAANMGATWISKRSEERKHVRELAMQAAVESWKQAVEIEKARQGKRLVPPLDIYLVHSFKLAEVLTNEKITAENVEEKLKRVGDISAVVRRHTIDKTLESMARERT